MASGGVSSPADALQDLQFRLKKSTLCSKNSTCQDLQFSDAEIQACVEEAGRRRTYVMAHAYTQEAPWIISSHRFHRHPTRWEAITRAVRLGVKSIEHGNYLDESAAEAMKAAGAYLSQTVITYKALQSHGAECGMPAAQVTKVAGLRFSLNMAHDVLNWAYSQVADLVAAGLQSLRIAHAHGVPITYGTDLLGATLPYWVRATSPQLS